MESFIFMGEKIEYRIVISKRKTVTILVSPDGILVRAPMGMSNQKINDLVLTKASWIAKKWNEMKLHSSNQPARKFVTGGEFKYRGEKKILVLRDEKKVPSKVEISQEYLIIWFNSAKETPQQVLECWLRKKAKERVIQRVNYYRMAYNIQKTPNRICIKDQKSRWGSCSTKNNLNFNYRLIMAPDSVLDYVVVHELSHLEYMNHSKEFWSYVAKIMPEYKQMREWLRLNGNELYL